MCGYCKYSTVISGNAVYSRYLYDGVFELLRTEASCLMIELMRIEVSGLMIELVRDD